MRIKTTIYFLLLHLFFSIACSENEDIDTPKADDEIQKRIDAIVPPQNQDVLKMLGITTVSGNNPPMM